MTADLGEVAAAIAARIRAMPEVRRIYPPRPTVAANLTGTAGTVTALVDDTAVRLRVEGGRLRVEVSVALDRAAAAPPTAGRVEAAVETVLDEAGVGPRHVTVRVASLER